MKEEDYVRVQNSLITVAQVTDHMLTHSELLEFIAAIGHADALGPILNPTLYRNGSEMMHRIGDLANAADVFLSAIATFRTQNSLALERRRSAICQEDKEHLD